MSARFNSIVKMMLVLKCELFICKFSQLTHELSSICHTTYTIWYCNDSPCFQSGTRVWTDAFNDLFKLSHWLASHYYLWLFFYILYSRSHSYAIMSFQFVYHQFRRVVHWDHLHAQALTSTTSIKCVKITRLTRQPNERTNENIFWIAYRVLILNRVAPDSDSDL